MTKLSRVPILPVGESVIIADCSFCWVAAHEDVLDRRLAGHWMFPLDSIRTRYIRVFPMYGGQTFLADNTWTEEEKMECNSRESLENLVQKWVGESVNAHWQASLKQ